MGLILYGAIGLAFLALMIALFQKASPGTLASLVRGAAAAAVGAAAVILFLRGQYGLAMASAAAVPMVLGRKALATFAGTPSAGQTSDVETAWFSMTLDHDSGHADGTVKQGAYAGRRFSQLPLTDLRQLHAACRGEPQSVALLEAYLDRVHPEWREADAEGMRSERPAQAQAQMSREEAFAVLGLQPGATAEEIREAHRQLMKKVHPDQGGSNYLASKINAAKDLLLR